MLLAPRERYSMRPRAAKRSEQKRRHIHQIQGDPKCLLSSCDWRAFSAALALLAATSSGALAQKKYDTGATDTEIKIGNIMPYSGPASAYGVIGKTEEAYFKMINDRGRHQRPQDQLHQL